MTQFPNIEFMLNIREIDQLGSLLELPDTIRSQLQNAREQKRRSVSLSLSGQDAKLLRDVLISEMALSGFDQDYNVTIEGRLLESLIDRLWEVQTQ